MGYNSLLNNTTGAQNTAIGSEALPTNTIGTENTAVGYQALYANTTGVENTAVGAGALRANTIGIGNVAVGRACLYTNTTGISNIAIGEYSLFFNVTGSYNTAVGYNSLNLSLGTRNTAVGNACGSPLTTGSNNTLIGDQAGNGAFNLTTGTDNVLVGYRASTSGTGGVNQIVIGADFSGAGNNTVSLGKAANYVYATFTSSATWTRTSDARLKTNINDDSLGLDFITKLRPVTYQWKPSNEVPQELTDHYTEENQMDTEVVMHGLLAQEVKAALDEVGVNTFEGWSEQKDGAQAISREMFITPLINAVKELKAELDNVKTELATLKGAA